VGAADVGARDAGRELRRDPRHDLDVAAFRSRRTGGSEAVEIVVEKVAENELSRCKCRHFGDRSRESLEKRKRF